MLTALMQKVDNRQKQMYHVSRKINSEKESKRNVTLSQE